MKNKRKAFSVAEATIALLIGSIVLGMAAPMITKQIKFQNMSDTQFRLINRANEDLRGLINETNNVISELQARIEELENEELEGIPAGMIAFFNSASCPTGWSAISSNWNGRFPRFAGNYTVYNWNTTDKTIDYNSGTAKILTVGLVEEDAIRNIVGTSSAHRNHYNYGSIVSTSGAFYHTQSSTNGNGGSGGSYNKYRLINFDSSRVVPTDIENRPKSVALLGCVKN